MAEQRIDVLEGWLVGEVSVSNRSSLAGAEYGGRLFLFRSPTAWTLLSVRHMTRWEDDRPVAGEAAVRVAGFGTWQELKSWVSRDHGLDGWRELVKAGAANDGELRELWMPVQIDLELEESSVHQPELGAHAWMRQMEGWQASALGLAANRLEELGFVVLEASTEYRTVFRHGGLEAWAGNAVVGTVVAARHGWRVELVVAVDGFGEVYTRSHGVGFDPGASRRYPPRRLTREESRRVEEVYRRRRDDERRRLHEEEGT